MSAKRRDEFVLEGSYSVREYGTMFGATVRGPAYLAALAEVVHPGTVVAEVGAGVALFSLMACRLGAARVYAIEPSPVLELAQRFAEDNGLADRLIGLESLATDIELPERVDVVIADLRGVLPFYRDSVSAVIDARDRFLKPGGTIIPARDTLWSAVVEAPEQYASITNPWTDATRGLDLQRGLEAALNAWGSAVIEPAQLLGDPMVWGTIDYAGVAQAAMTGTAECRVNRAGTGHGTAAWFDTELTDGIGFSNAPGKPRTLHGQAFFPWSRPVDLHPGDIVRSTYRVLPGLGEFVWTWDTSIVDRHGQERAVFRQSTFLGSIFPTADTKRRAHSHVPHLSDRAELDREILVLIDGHHTLGEIATQVHESHPGHFHDWNAALQRVAGIARIHERRGDGAR